MNNNLKKYLPLILLGIGLLVVVVGIIVTRNKKTEVATDDEEEVNTEIAFSDKPYVTLTPSEDGHWLTLKVDNIKLNAKSVDYELLYDLADGRSQMVPGTVNLTEKSFEKKLLLGSESSGKFRYDEGVQKGTLTFRFRNDKGKLIGKMSDKFKLINAEKELTSIDNNFKYTLDKKPKTGFFVVMSTFGLPQGSKELASSPYGVYTTNTGDFAGAITMKGTKVLNWSGSEWKEIPAGKSSELGVFASEN